MKHTAFVAVLLMAAVGVTAQQPATNYDETKVPSYTLPPLLVAKDGSSVRTAADWTKRRAEILALLEDQMFGKAPARPSELWFGVDEIGEAFGGLAIRKQGTIRVAGRTLALLVYLPARATKPVPVFVSLGFNPNHAVNADPGIRLAGAWTQDSTTKAIAAPGPRSGLARVGGVPLGGRTDPPPRLWRWRRCTTVTSSLTSRARKGLVCEPPL